MNLYHLFVVRASRHFEDDKEHSLNHVMPHKIFN